MICIDCGQDIYSGEEQCEDCKNSTGSGMAQNVLLHGLGPSDPVCGMCNNSAHSNSMRRCTNCNKCFHMYCDNSDGGLDGYLCIICRQTSLVSDGNVMLNSVNNDPISPLTGGPSVQQMNLNEMMVVARPNPPSHQPDFEQLYQQHHSHHPTQTQIKEEFSDNTTNDSAQNSPFYTESSDYDEDFVPGSSRGRGRGSGAKKKPGRGSSLLKKQPILPQTGFYSAAQLQALTQPTSTRGKRGKRGMNKAPGKGGGRGRGRGRASANALQQQQQQQHQQQLQIQHHQNPMQPLQSPQMQLQPLQHSVYPIMHQQMSFPTNSFQHVPPPSMIREVDESLITMDETSRQSAATRADDVEYVRTIVVCSSEDMFMRKACLCLVCGAVGKGLESSMVACSNCAQTYHTYCVGLHDKLNSTVVFRGWRCLDCTVCEGCGKGGDESKLLLCEECDVSYHIYCLKPPLDRIPSSQWRCQWCARCRRCNIKVTVQTELTQDGLCLPCNSLRKCQKCLKRYKIGDKIIRCSQCNKWQHGPCENLFNDEMLEQAAINRMRCSTCRPNKSNLSAAFGDDVIICDNVALSKNADEVLKSKFMPSLVRPAALESYGYRDSFDHYGGEEEYTPVEETESFVAQRGRGRGNPGGRRGTNRIGIGGFYAKLPRHRVLALTEEANAMNNLDEEDLKKLKRPRKPRRSQLEDAYPPAIQEAFFGIKAVEGKALVDISVEEPSLAEYGNGKIGQSDGAGHELSSSATEMLINDIAENNFLENVDLGDIDGDLDNVDLSIFDDGLEFDDDFEDSLGGLDMDMKTEINLDDINVKPLDATTFPMDQPSSSSAYNNFGGQQQMPIQNPMYPNEANNYAPTTGHTLSRSSSTNNADPPERYQFSERWEEDEPLGLQATTAAVLYANEKHGHLKDQYPEWTDRVKQIQRLWRTLSADERQEYVNRARENRTNRGRNPRPRRNIAHSNSVDSPTVQSPAPHQMGRSDGFKVPAVPGGNGTPLYDQEPVVQQPAQPPPPPPKQLKITCHLVPEVFMQYRQIIEKQGDLEKIVASMEGDLTKQRKQKKNLAAKKRQMIKTATAAPGYDGKVIDLNDADKVLLVQLTESIKSLQGDLENSKRDMKSHEASVREFEVKNMILKNENEVTQQMIDQTQMMNQQATVQDNVRMQMMRQQQQMMHIQQQQQQLQQQQQQQRMQGMPVPGQPQMAQMGQMPQMQQMQQMPPGVQMGMHPMRGPQGQPLPGQPPPFGPGPQGVMMQRPPGQPGPSGMQPGPPGMQGPPQGIPGGPHGMPGPPQGMPGPPQMQQMTVQQQQEMRRLQIQQAQRRAAMMRAPVMGGVRYDQIEDPIERQVYECVDDVLMHVAAFFEQHTRENHMLKRLLDPSTGTSHPAQVQMNPHVQQGPSGLPPPPPVEVEGPKPKKKRTMQKKATQLLTSGSEYDSWIEKMRTRFRLCPEIPKRAREPPLNGLRANFATQGIADFLILPNRRFLVGNEIGKMNLSFVDDFFTGDDRTSRTLAHKDISMQDIAPSASLLYLHSSQHTPVDEEYVFDELDARTPSFHPLSVLNEYLNKRRDVPLEHIRAQIRSAQTQGPIEPLRRMFYVEPKEEMVDVEITMLPDAPHFSAFGEKIGEGGVDETKYQLIDILKMETKPEFKNEDTPPMSPFLSPPQEQERVENPAEREIKMEVDEECETPPVGTTSMLREIKKEIAVQPHKCQKCAKNVDPISGVRQKMGKLGFLSNDASEVEKEDTAYFCSMKCYYELMATSKVPLSHDEVNAAESVVDEETYNQLKQIHSDNIVKAVNQGKAKLPCAPSVSMMEGLISPKDTRYMMDEGRRELITMIPVSTLSTSTEKPPEPPRVPTDEWKVYTENIAESFLRMQVMHQEYIRSQKMGVVLPQYELDERTCVLCGGRGDGETSICGRLLALVENFWVHVNCALWSNEVFENPTGGLVNVDRAIVRANNVICVNCGKKGASVRCHKLNCPNEYHVTCALQTQGYFIKDRTFICRLHGPVSIEVAVQRLDALRRIYIQRCENDLLKQMFELTDGPKSCLRLGAFSFYNVGQILPEQLKTFHNKHFIFPNGYKVNRWFWSPKTHKERILFECTITDRENKPYFNVKAIDDPEISYSGETATAAWSPIFEQVLQQRGAVDMLRFFSSYVHGETLFGLNEGVISKITESLPGADQMFTYNFRHENSPILDLPLAENPMGCARAEPRFRTLIKHHRVKPAASSSTNGASDGPKTSSSSSSLSAGRTRGSRPSFMDEQAAAQIKAMGLSAEYAAIYMKNLEPAQSASQTFSAYQKMRREWKNTVYLARSKIQGLGLYAKHDISMGDFIIEYKGEVIRSEVGEVREKRYNSQNRGVYMFRIDEEWIIDATMAGGPARYINHSCDPNCSTRIHDPGSGPAEKKIIITANRPIMANEELTYDYQFELEDSTDKIPCLCGAPNCVKWMN